MVTWTMNDNDRLKRTINEDLDVRASDRTLAHMRDTVLDSHGLSQEAKSALTLTIARRKIMRNPIVKFAVAAAVVAAALMGATLFRSSGSGVAWAEVARKVQASRGTVYRMQQTDADSPSGADHAMVYSSPTRERADYYKDGRIFRSIYVDYETKTVVYIIHEGKRYIRDTHSLHQFGVQQRQNWIDPKGLVQKFLSCEHKKLEPQTIERTLCEGLETTDPTFFGSDFPVPISRLNVQLWVSTATGYPVLFKAEVVCGEDGERRIEGTADQFQWDVELDPSELEPTIPDDYTLEEWPS